MRFTPRTAAVALLVGASLALSACGSGPVNTGVAGNSPAAAGDGITVYNAQHETLGQQWADDFTRRTGVKVVLRNGSDTELSNQIIQEGANSPADVFLTENSPAMSQVENAGLFADTSSAVRDNVPAQFRPASNTWTGIAARSTVFVYNKDKLTTSRLPKSLMDLQDQRWKGRWGAAPSGADFQAIVSAMLQLKGKDATSAWLSALQSGAKAYKSNSAVMKAVNTGEIDGGVIFHYYYFNDQAKTGENSNKVALGYFKNQDPGAFVSVSGGGVLRSSTKQANAQKFLEYLTGPDGQKVLQDNANEYTVNPGVPARKGLVPLDQLQYPDVKLNELNGSEVVNLMTKAGLL